MYDYHHIGVTSLNITECYNISFLFFSTVPSNFTYCLHYCCFYDFLRRHCWIDDIHCEIHSSAISHQNCLLYPKSLFCSRTGLAAMTGTCDFRPSAETIHHDGQQVELICLSSVLSLLSLAVLVNEVWRRSVNVQFWRWNGWWVWIFGYWNRSHTAWSC